MQQAVPLITSHVVLAAVLVRNRLTRTGARNTLNDVKSTGYKNASSAANKDDTKKSYIPNDAYRGSTTTPLNDDAEQSFSELKLSAPSTTTLHIVHPGPNREASNRGHKSTSTRQNKRTSPANKSKPSKPQGKKRTVRSR